MRRSEALLKLQRFYIVRHVMVEGGYITPNQFMAEVLDYIESLGMMPPRLPEEDCQALMSIYYGGYTTHQWEEDFVKDEKAQEAKKRRAEAAERRKQKATERAIERLKKGESR